MTQEHLIIFHQKTPGGWAPGNFMARTRISPETAQRMNERFNASGVKVKPLQQNIKVAKKMHPYQIE